MGEDDLKIIVVDDEEPARKLVRAYLDDIDNVTVVAECGNGFEAVKAVAAHDPDLILLDIQMPKLDGFEVLELLERDIPVIFVTAHDEHALRAFEVCAVDYLLKPLDAARLTEALQRARDRIGRGDPPPSVAELAASARPGRNHLERILIRDGSEVHVLPVRSVDYFEARDDAIAVFSNGESFLKAQRLQVLEDQLDPAIFVRVHRSFILNLDRLRSIELYAKDSRIAILVDGTKVPISRSGYAKLRQLL